MNGFQITFYTQSDRRHDGKPIGQWLIGLAQVLKLHGATLQAGAEGFGRSKRLHSAGFFELADQPIEFVTVVSAEQADQLFARLQAESLNIFYVKTAVEFGIVGGDSGA